MLYYLKYYVQDLQFLSKGVGIQHAHSSKEDKDLALELGSSTIYKILTILHELKYNCQEPDFVFALLKIGSVINGSKKNQQSPNGGVSQSPSERLSQSPNERVSQSSVFGKNAIQSHLESSNKRSAVNNNQINESSKLTSSRFKEILGGR